MSWKDRILYSSWGAVDRGGYQSVIVSLVSPPPDPSHIRFVAQHSSPVVRMSQLCLFIACLPPRTNIVPLTWLTGRLNYCKPTPLYPFHTHTPISVQAGNWSLGTMNMHWLTPCGKIIAKLTIKTFYPFALVTLRVWGAGWDLRGHNTIRIISVGLSKPVFSVDGIWQSQGSCRLRLALCGIVSTHPFVLFCFLPYYFSFLFSSFSDSFYFLLHSFFVTLTFFAPYFCSLPISFPLFLFFLLLCLVQSLFLFLYSLFFIYHIHCQKQQ